MSIESYEVAHTTEEVIVVCSKCNWQDKFTLYGAGYDVDCSLALYFNRHNESKTVFDLRDLIECRNADQGI